MDLRIFRKQSFDGLRKAMPAERRGLWKGEVPNFLTSESLRSYRSAFHWITFSFPSNEIQWYCSFCAGTPVSSALRDAAGMYNGTGAAQRGQNFWLEPKWHRQAHLAMIDDRVIKDTWWRRWWMLRYGNLFILLPSLYPINPSKPHQPPLGNRKLGMLNLSLCDCFNIPLTSYFHSFWKEPTLHVTLF